MFNLQLYRICGTIFPSVIPRLLLLLAMAVSLSGQSRWEWSVPPQGGDLTKIAYGNGRFVAIGTRTISVSSDEGAHWSSTIPEPVTDMHSIAFGAGVFVVTGDNSLLMSSPDGVNWTPQSFPDSLNFWSVAFGNNIFIAMGLIDGKTETYTSADGATWKKTARLGDIFSSMVFGNGIFLTVSVSSNHFAYSSVDGQTWESVANIPNCTGLTVIHDRFFSRWNIDEVGGFRWSDDGKSWNTIETDYDEFLNLAGWFDNGQYYLYPVSEKIVLKSANCSTWTSQSVGEFRNPIAIANSPTTIIALTSYGGIYSSADGISWTRQAAGTTPRQLISIAYGNGMFVAVDGNARQTAGARSEYLINSTDGKNWTTAQGDFDLRYMNGVFFVNNRFVVTGAKGKILTSTDGITWTQIQTPDTLDVFMCAYGDGKYVITGGTCKFYTSGDLTTWKYNYVDMMGGVDCIFPIDDLFVLSQHNKCTVRFVDNGKPERTMLPEMMYMVSSIARGNDRYIGVGSHIIVSSTDGTNWVSEDSVTPLHFHNLLFCNNRFVAIVSRWALTVSCGIYKGSDQAIGTSADGIHWTLHNIGLGEELYAMAYGNNRFVAVGKDGAVMVSQADDPNEDVITNPQTLKPARCTMRIREQCLSIQSPELAASVYYTTTIFNVCGRKVVSARLQPSDDALNIHLSNLSPGTYFATVSEDAQVKLSGRIILAR